MPTKHIYITDEQAAQIAALKAKTGTTASKLLRRGLVLALAEAEGVRPTGGLAAPARYFTVGEGPVAPAPAEAPAAPAEIVVDPNAIRVLEHEGEVIFHVGDLCRRVSVDLDYALSDISSPAWGINDETYIDLNGVKEVLSLSFNPNLADEVRAWATEQEAATA